MKESSEKTPELPLKERYREFIKRVLDYGHRLTLTIPTTALEDSPIKIKNIGIVSGPDTSVKLQLDIKVTRNHDVSGLATVVTVTPQNRGDFNQLIEGQEEKWLEEKCRSKGDKLTKQRHILILSQMREAMAEGIEKITVSSFFQEDQEAHKIKSAKFLFVSIFFRNTFAMDFTIVDTDREGSSTNATSELIFRRLMATMEDLLDQIIRTEFGDMSMVDIECMHFCAALSRILQNKPPKPLHN